jgi:integrase
MRRARLLPNRGMRASTAGSGGFEGRSAHGHLSRVIVPMLQHHVDTYAQPGRLGLVFVGEKGAPLRHCNFSDKWATALEVAGLADVHFHDLRHSGNT